MYFVDTNLLVYLHDSAEPEKKARATEIMETLWGLAEGRISFQVLQEFYTVSTRKLKPGLTPAAARAEVRDLMSWKPQQVTSALIEQAWEIEDCWELSWWDSLIVAAALLQNCSVLLTEDLQEGLQIEQLQIINPFASDFAIRGRT